MSSVVFYCFKQKTAYEMRISDWSSDVCSSDLHAVLLCAAFVALCDAHTIGAVLVDDRDAKILGLAAQLRLREVREHVRRHLAELAAMHLWAEAIAEMPVLEHRRRDAGVDPDKLLGGIDLRREGQDQKGDVEG